MRKMRCVPGLLLCSLLIALSGCGAAKQKAEYPAMKTADMSKWELATVESETASYAYAAELWTQKEEMVNSLVLYQRDTMDTEQPVSIQLQVAGKRKQALDETLMNQVLKQLEKNASLTVELCELRSFEGSPVIYMENAFHFDDQVIEQMIENKLWTEESLEQAGGREAMLALPDSRSIVVYGIVDGNLVIYGGTYYEEAQKQTVIDAILVMMQTINIK